MAEAETRDYVEIVPYDERWPQLAAQEIGILRKALPFKWLIDVQHIGSTAVPGLSAKPIIDIYVGVSDLASAKCMIESLEKLGYVYWYDNPNKEKMFFVKGMPPFGKQRTHHVHVVLHDSDYWRARLIFRDYLRAHVDMASLYAELKLNLAKKHGDDRELYTDRKYEFVAEVLRLAGFSETVRR